LPVPLDVILCFHNAFRRDIAEIDSTVLDLANNGGNLSAVLDRFHIMGELLDYHARGEEAAVFPALDKVAPLVAQAYLMDHRELDKMVDVLEVLRSSPDPLKTNRAMAIIKSHLTIHLNKEDVHPYQILRERTTTEEQASIARIVSSKVPSDRFPTVIQWLFPLLHFNDQATVINGWANLMPKQVFDNIKPLIKKATNENWLPLSQKIPALM
jgi:hypothetical protein